MNNVHLSIVVIILFNSLLATSNSFAVTAETIAISKDIEARVGATAELAPPSIADSTTASACPMEEATIETPEFVNVDETEAAALDWLQNALQMSIDLSGEPQGDKPDYSCMNPPYYCSSTETCPLSGGKKSICALTSCGIGECSACPIKNSGVIIASWCAYSCMAGKDVVGGAFKLRTSWGSWLGPVCL